MKNSKMFPVVHFEMPTMNRKRSAEFYRKAFGWKMDMLGQDMGDYTVAITAELGKNGFPKNPGRINGGFFPKKKGWPAQYPSVVIAVDDINQQIKIVKKSGGKVLGKPMEIPGYGLIVSFYDTEKNRVSMIQPFMDGKGRRKIGK